MNLAGKNIGYFPPWFFFSFLIFYHIPLDDLTPYVCEFLQQKNMWFGNLNAQ